MKPELRQFDTLTLDDFVRCPVWLACHVADYDEPWYDETDEETFRPWPGSLPVDPSEGMFLVKATARLADGSSYPGFLTPVPEPELGQAQPQVFVGGKRFWFWGGMPGVPRQLREEFYSAVGKSPGDVFPIQFTVEQGAVKEPHAIEVHGFYRSTGLTTSTMER